MGNFWYRFRQNKNYFVVAVVALLIGVFITVGCTSTLEAKVESGEKNRFRLLRQTKRQYRQ